MKNKCTKCGAEFNGNYCPDCGTQQIVQTANKSNTDATEKPWFTILTLFLFFPVGLYFMWKNKIFKTPVRVGITVFFAIVTLNILVTGSDDQNTDSYASNNDKIVETSITNTPIPTPTEVPLSDEEKFVIDVTSITGVQDESAYNLYDMLHSQLGFDKVSITGKNAVGNINYDFNADKYSLMVAFDVDDIYNIVCGDYTLYDGKEIKIDKQGLLDRSLDKKETYYTIAQEIIKDNLKSPKSAEFPSMLWNSDAINVQRNGDTVAVQSYVDSQNSFGALIRSEFLVEFTIVDIDSYTYVPFYINIDGEKVGEWIDLD